MASGLPPNIVEQIVEAEKVPIRQLENRKAAENEKLTLVSDLETKLNGITNNLGSIVGTRGFLFQKLISGDPSIIDGTVDPNQSVSGDWQLEVQQLANKPGAVSNGFPDRNESEIGVGYLNFVTGAGEKKVYVGKTATLDGVANAINTAGIGVRAMVVNDRTDSTAPFKLMITGLQTGQDKQVSFPTVYMLDGDRDFFFEKSIEAKNAKFKLDGFEMEVAENTVRDVIPGVTLDLKQAVPGKPVSLKIKDDVETISGKVKEFVDSYNGVLSFIQGQHKLQKNKAGREGLGPLGGDSLLRSIENRLRALAQNRQVGVGGGVNRLGDLGIEFNRAGTLNFDQQKFNATLSRDPSGVANFLRGDGSGTGFVPALRRELGAILNGGFGPIANRKRSTQQRIDSMDRQIENKERQISRREESLRRQFSNLESTMSKLQQQGASLGGAIAGGQRG